MIIWDKLTLLDGHLLVASYNEWINRVPKRHQRMAYGEPLKSPFESSLRIWFQFRFGFIRPLIRLWLRLCNKSNMVLMLRSSCHTYKKHGETMTVIGTGMLNKWSDLLGLCNLTHTTESWLYQASRARSHKQYQVDFLHMIISTDCFLIIISFFLHDFL